MKFQAPNSNIQKMVLLLFILCFGATAAFGAAITKSGSSELGEGTFSNIRISGETVVLSLTAEAQWTPGGVKLNSSSTGSRTGVGIDSDGAGGLWVVWADDRRGASATDIYGAHVDSSGSATEITIRSTGTEVEQPDIVKSVNGTATDGMIVVYRDAAVNNIEAKKYDTSNVAQWKTIVYDGGQPLYNPRLASDKSGGAVFVWQDWRDTSNSSPSIVAQRLDDTGSIPSSTNWLTNGITICAASVSPSTLYPKTPLITSMKSGQNDEGYIITWYDTREGFQDIYASRVEDDGDIDTGNFSTNGIKITNSGIYKEERTQVSALTYNGALTIFEQGADEASQNVVVQLTQGDGTGRLGSAGLTLNASAGQMGAASVAALPAYEAVFAWVDASAGTAYAQRITAYGTPEWGAGGKALSGRAIVKLAYDGDNGVYGGAVSGSVGSYVPYVQRIDSSGNELWGVGVPIVSYGISKVADFQIVASENPGVIAVWADGRTTDVDIYAQKFEQKFRSSGTYTSAKIENTASGFAGWTTMSWVETALTGEFRTAATSADLDSASWQSISNSGNVGSSDQWLQARFSFTATADRSETPSLTSFTVNYSTESDLTSPEVASVKVGGVELASGDYVPASPTIDVVLTDDERLASAAINLDGSPLVITYVSTNETTWNLRVSPTITVGDHTLQVNVADAAGNSTSVSYDISRVAASGVKGGSVKAMASGDQVTVAYELTASAKVRIEVRDIMGRKVKEVMVDAGLTGGAAGYNEVNIDASDLGIGVYFIYVAPVGGTPAVGKFSISQ